MSRSEAQTPPITREQFVARLTGLCLKSGLSGFPRKSRDRHIMLKSVALALDKTHRESRAAEPLRSQGRAMSAILGEP